MKHILLIILPVLLLAGCCGLIDQTKQDKYAPAPNNPPMKTCADINCMEQSIDTCTPAQFEMTQEGTTILAEVRGTSAAKKCITYVKLIELNKTQVPDEFKFMAGTVEGKDVVCAFSQEDIYKIKTGHFDKELLSNCDGPLKGILEIVIASQE